MNPVNTKPYITGCSSGIGRALAELIANKPSHHLIATARKVPDLSYLPDDNPNILKVALDVTSVDSVKNAFTAAKEHFGDNWHLDVVVNNAGYSLSGDTEGATEEESHLEIETLFFGTARVTMKAVEVMRQDKVGEEWRGGVVFNVSSLAGLVGLAGHAYYHAGKHAVEGWTESVAREMSPDWNINFCIIEPSGVRTNFEGHSKAAITPHPAYADPSMPARKLESYVKMGMKAGAAAGMMEPKQVAETIYKIAARGEKVPLRLPLGKVAWMMGKGKFEGLLREWEEVKEISFMGKEGS
ncbi:related to ketoreductases [Phialocephala subalpina]|uniref:Related to ketoreductases n=1 Tax=Phialocephala subalpina TaxID=576137 RepID=A0A1L7XU28_9HELO|nr:related to ketoreductases [Phialocephala subalpina]